MNERPGPHLVGRREWLALSAAAVAAASLAPTGAALAQTPKRGGTLNLGFDYGGRLMAAWLDR